MSIQLSDADVDSSVITSNNSTNLYSHSNYSQANISSNSSSSSCGQNWDAVLLTAVANSIPADAAPPDAETVQFKNTYHTQSSSSHTKQQQQGSLTTARTTDKKSNIQDGFKTNIVTTGTSTPLSSSAQQTQHQDPVHEFLSHLPDLSYLLRRTEEIC